MSELSIPGTNLRSFIFRKLPAILTPISDIVTAKSNIFFTSKRLPWMIIFLGVALRLAQYLANRSLWLDESYIALNIVQRSFSQLFGPLDYHQVAPIGFLLIEKVAVQAFGNTEYALRLFPLFSGIVALLLLYKLASWYLAPRATIIALGLFSIADPLIYYSSEVKQYSSDVAVALILYLIAVRCSEREKLTLGQATILGIVGSIAIWFSHPAIFILAGIGTTLTLVSLKNKEWQKISQLSIVASFWLLNFVLFYFVFARKDLSNIESLATAWGQGRTTAGVFMPFLPLSLSEIMWFVKAFTEIFFPTGLSAAIAALPFIVACVSALQQRNGKFFILLSPIVFALLASGFDRYPFSGRLLLFVGPAVLIVIADGLNEIRDKTRHAPIIWITVVALLFFPRVIDATYYLKEPRTKEEISPAISYLKEHRRDKDVIYLYCMAYYSFRYYQNKYGFTDNDYIVGILSRDNWRKYIADLDKLRGYPRVWLVFSHVYRGNEVDEERLYLYHLDSIGKRLDSFKTVGAAVYLYDLTGPLPAKQL